MSSDFARRHPAGPVAGLGYRRLATTARQLRLAGQLRLAVR